MINKTTLHHYINIVIRLLRQTSCFGEKPGIRCAIIIIAGIIISHIPTVTLPMLLFFLIPVLCFAIYSSLFRKSYQKDALLIMLILIIVYVAALKSLQKNNMVGAAIERDKGEIIQVSGLVRRIFKKGAKHRGTLRLSNLTEQEPQNRRILQASKVSLPFIPAQIEYGTRVEIRGRLTGMVKTSRKNITRLVIAEASLLDFQTTPYTKFKNSVFSYKRSLAGVFKETVSPPVNRLLAALLLGERRGLGRELIGSFQRAGVIHVLAISGLHLGLLLGFFTLFLRAFSCPKKVIMVSLIVVLIIYLHLVNFRPSVVRASVMMGLVIGATLLARPYDLINILGATVSIIALWQPSALLSIGMQLSLAATFFLIAALPPLNVLIFSQYYFSRLERMFINSLLVSIFAWLGVWPLIALYFNEINLMGVIANLVVVPLIAGVLFIGFCLMLLSGISSFAVMLLGRPVYYLGSFTLMTVEFFASHNHLLFPGISPSIPAVIMYYFLAVVFFAWLASQSSAVRVISLPSQNRLFPAGSTR